MLRNILLQRRYKKATYYYTCECFWSIHCVVCADSRADIWTSDKLRVAPKIDSLRLQKSVALVMPFLEFLVNLLEYDGGTRHATEVKTLTRNA